MSDNKKYHVKETANEVSFKKRLVTLWFELKAQKIHVSLIDPGAQAGGTS